MSKTIHALAWLVPMLIAPATAMAAYKCVVDGKTTYQEKPCDEDVKKRGGEKQIQTPTGKTNLPGEEGMVNKAENQRRDALVKSDLEPRAREVFSMLKGGRMIELREASCIRTRQLMNNPAFVDGLRREAEAYNKRKTTIDKVESASSTGVTFFAVEPGVPVNPSKPAQQAYVAVYFQWEEGKPCVTHMGTWTKDIGK